jgi:hypothetical protein
MRLWEKRASNGKLVRSVPRVTAETPENGLTMGENVEMGHFGKRWASDGKSSTTGTLPRVTAETPKNGLTMGENMETGDFGKKGKHRKTCPFGTTCYSGNP